MTRWLPALLVAGLAWALRVYGAGFGLPILSNFYIRPDESLVVVSAVELVERAGNPGHLNYPAFMMEVLAFLFAWVPGTFADDPSRYFLVARLFSATCGAAATLGVYLLARRWTTMGPALAAALWYAASPLAVREAHFAVTDTLLALMVLLAVGMAGRWFTSPASRAAAMACGTSVGLAAATKYNAGVLAPALAVAFILAATGLPFRARLRSAVVMALSAVLTFLIVNPWLVSQPAELLNWMGVLARALYLPRPDLAMAPDLVRGPSGLVLLAFLPGAWIGVVAALAGAAAVAVRARDDRSLWPLVAATTAFVLLLAPTSVLPLRYLSPLLPLVAVLGALGLHAAARPGVVWAAAIVGLAFTVPEAIRLDMSLAREDSRSEAGRWIAANVPPEVPVIWLGEPESEPQVQEKPASLDRRVRYVERRYGAGAARVIERPYLLLKDAPASRGPSARDVYRNPEPHDVAAPVVCVVWARYPLPMVSTDPAAREAWTGGRVMASAAFGDEPLSPRLVLEPSDAFFLPMRLDRVYQPGPRIEVRVVARIQ